MYETFRSIVSFPTVASMHPRNLKQSFCCGGPCCAERDCALLMELWRSHTALSVGGACLHSLPTFLMKLHDCNERDGVTCTEQQLIQDLLETRIQHPPHFRDFFFVGGGGT